VETVPERATKLGLEPLSTKVRRAIGVPAVLPVTQFVGLLTVVDGEALIVTDKGTTQFAKLVLVA
jgi:hypothetical protein